MHEPEPDEIPKAKISYSVEGDDIIIDVEIEDFNEECMEALGLLCGNLSTEKISYETIANIRDKIIEHNRPELLVSLVSSVNYHSNLLTKLTDTENDTTKIKPCIRPSDMM